MIQVTSEILPLLSEIISQDDFSPSEKINTLFSKFISQIAASSDSYFDKLISSEKILEIRLISQHAEFLLEKEWAKKIISHEVSLEMFPYFENYRLLVTCEYQKIKYFLHTQKPILFVGSGPLPLSAILYAKFFSLSVVCVERDLEALELSQKVITSLGLTEKITFIHADVFEMSEFNLYNFVFVGAAVGISFSEKKELFLHLSKYFDFLVFRSIQGLRELLYAPVPLNLRGFTAHEHFFLPRLINHLVIFTKNHG